ncbi:hypothetical protein [Coleofasciculus sp.]|uniref:hypothetical protein n=1 Tax=Coleofasciculus sp. TaxID=3100458 RepID=UPI0039FAD696
MKKIKAFSAGCLLIISLSILLLGTIDLANPNSTKKDKEGALATIVLFGLPSAAMGTWLIWSLRQQNQKKLEQLNLAKEQLLLHLIQQNQGKITVTGFAASAQISIEEAQQYLDEKAKQLNANFEATDEGGIIYQFPR